MMKGIQTIKHVALASATLLGLTASPAFAQYDDTMAMSADDTQAGKMFGMTHAPVDQVALNQVQIVYYCAQTGGGNAKANVYVDAHYQTSLLQNGYTTFCVQQGNHTLGAYLHDVPVYRGKTKNLFETNLKAGAATYFLKAQEGGHSAPFAVSREQAERELQGARARAQLHGLSRAPTTVACNVSTLVVTPAASQSKDYTLQSDMLFAFGKAEYRDINTRGRKAFACLFEQMHRENTEVKLITVVGHADQIGSAAAAEKLGLQRAKSVRSMLIGSGIPAWRIGTKTAGNTEPVVNDCRGSREQQIACYAPNRRVVVRVHMTSAD
ncbi:hypothetical protein WK68_14715 [Burkholderia ubonensis]|nr:hypothetical protein WK68_14715 [Burkholderia ubonensis]